jgi:dihydroneopterin aldolase
MLARDAARALREVARRACGATAVSSSQHVPWCVLGSAHFRGTDSVESRLPASARARGAASSSALVGERSTRSRASVRGHSRRFASERPSRGASRDKIHLESLVFHGYHGVLPEEKALGQKFVVDVTMSVCHLRSGASDDIADTVDYAAAYELIRREVEGKENAKDLIERVGAGVADALLRAFPNAKDVAVRVRKPHVAVAGVVGSLGIEVYRDRLTTDDE